MSSELTKELIRVLSEPHSQVNLSGVSYGAFAFIASELIHTSDFNFLIIVNDNSLAAKLHQDIKNYLHSFLSKKVNKLDLFPGWETSPYLLFTPSLNNQIKRARTLARLADKSSKYCITDVSSILQKCPKKSVISNKIFNFKVGESYTREELILCLHECGYQHRDPVEDPGSYAFRGGLLDVFSSYNSRPYRIEFFGDEIESIREYDSNTQKTVTQGLNEFVLYPTKEWLIDSAAISTAKQTIKLFSDTHEIPKKERDRFFEPIELGVLDPSLEFLFPFFNNSSNIGWLGDWIDNSFRILVFNCNDLEAKADSDHEEFKNAFAKSLSDKKIIPSNDDLFIPPQELISFLKKSNPLNLNQFRFGIPEAKNNSEVDESESASVESFKIEEDTYLTCHENNNKTVEQFVKLAQHWENQSYCRAIFASTVSQKERIKYLLEQRGLKSEILNNFDLSNRSTLQLLDGQISSGFRIPELKIAILSDFEWYGAKKAQSKQNEKNPYAELGSLVSSLDDLRPLDTVVHQKHGVGRYVGMVKLEIEKIPQDFLLIEYAGSDKLYLPVYRLDQIQKYIGSEGASSVSLDKLGSGIFQKTKEKVRSELKDLAHELLQLYAKRGGASRAAYSPADENYSQFEGRFPYPETQDQLRAIDDVNKDLSSDKIMDRLVCGDVGYGKTEVAMRAAYRAVLDSKQVAVLVPTTVLALQHERSFLERFKDTPVRIASLSRFKTSKEIKASLESLKAGQVDIIIGTHRVLSKDVIFKNLGLLIVDEEQRFGVENKEKIKALKIQTDVLTLTATPIPRTLQMSLLGLRDISLINTAPVDRLSIRTYIARFDEEVIKKAIEQELSRGGQVFFIHNRVQSIHSIADKIKQLLPNVRTLVAHGQMNEKDLENAMVSFYNKEADVLICTAIIESGLDVPSANTMIINRADMFGLAQLYQLRGRVGRSTVRAYCYLLIPEEGNITDDATKRLEVIQRFVELGSGFKIANHDLEIRGGGDLLGKSQSGQVSAIGFEMFMELLEETIAEIKGKEIKDKFDPEIRLPVASLIPESYISDPLQRLHFYKLLSDLENPEGLNDIELEMQDRYGKLTLEVQNLFWLIRLKLILRQYHIKALTVGLEKTSLETTLDSKLSVQKMLLIVQKSSHKFSLTPDSKIIIKTKFDSPQKLFQELQDFFTKVAEQ